MFFVFIIFIAEFVVFVIDYNRIKIVSGRNVGYRFIYGREVIIIGILIIGVRFGLEDLVIGDFFFKVVCVF